MKIITLLLCLPFIVLADRLTNDEIEILKDPVFHADTGTNSEMRPRTHGRYTRTQDVFLMFFENEAVTPKQEWLDLIEVICSEITQLTSIKFNFHWDVNDIKSLREIVKGRGATVIGFFPPSSKKIGGMQGRVSGNAVGQSASIYINSQYPERVIRHVTREEIINSMGMFGDTWKTRNTMFWQGGTDLDPLVFTEVDRRIIYAYYAMGENSKGGTYFTLEEFNERIVEVEIDQEIVYGGLFTEQTKIEQAQAEQAKIEQAQAEQAKIEQAQAEQVQASSDTGATNVDWLYFKQYPWVYSNKTGSWYYMLPRDEGIHVWSQLDSQWSKMSVAFGI